MVKAFIQPCFCLWYRGKGGGSSRLSGYPKCWCRGGGEREEEKLASVQRCFSVEARQLPVSPLVAPGHPSPTLFFSQGPLSAKAASALSLGTLPGVNNSALPVAGLCSPMP